jgi:hypothetical protein
VRLHAAAVGCDEIDEAQACGKHAAGEGNEGRGTAQGVPVTWLALHAVVMLLELTSFRSLQAAHGAREPSAANDEGDGDSEGVGVEGATTTKTRRRGRGGRGGGGGWCHSCTTVTMQMRLGAGVAGATAAQSCAVVGTRH